MEGTDPRCYGWAAGDTTEPLVPGSSYCLSTALRWDGIADPNRHVEVCVSHLPRCHSFPSYSPASPSPLSFSWRAGEHLYIRELERGHRWHVDEWHRRVVCLTYSLIHTHTRARARAKFGLSVRVSHFSRLHSISHTKTDDSLRQTG